MVCEIEGRGRHCRGRAQGGCSPKEKGWRDKWLPAHQGESGRHNSIIGILLGLSYSLILYLLYMSHIPHPLDHPGSNQPQSLHSALQMDSQQQLPQLPPAQPPRKRKKNDSSDEPSEPRRLRRSHEACARCRSKKIKVSHRGKSRRATPTAIALPL